MFKNEKSICLISAIAGLTTVIIATAIVTVKTYKLYEKSNKTEPMKKDESE